MKKYFNLLLFPICILLFDQSIFGQEILTLAMAKQLVKNHPQVQTLYMQKDLAKMQAYKNNTGVTPRLDWNANAAGSYNYVNQTFANRDPINRLGRAINPNTNLAYTMPLYDGGRANARLAILNKQVEIADVNVDNYIETLEDNITLTYLDILQQKETIKFLEANQKYYNDKLQITKQRWDVGRGSKLDFLQSSNDLNSQKVALENANQRLNTSKISLNLLIGRSPEIKFDVEDMIETVNALTKEELIALATKNDERLALIDKDMEIVDLQIKELESNKKPRVNLNGAFGYNLSNTNAGFFLINQSLGLNGGVNMNWNIYDAGHNKKQIEIANFRKKMVESQKNVFLQEVSNQVETILLQINSAEIVRNLEEENKRITQENLNIALEKFTLGASAILELNDAQQRNDDANNRFLNAQYDKRILLNRLELIIK
jgi:outer membrane protein